MGTSEWLEVNRRRSAGRPVLDLGEAQTHGRQSEGCSDSGWTVRKACERFASHYWIRPSTW